MSDRPTTNDVNNYGWRHNYSMMTSPISVTSIILWNIPQLLILGGMFAPLLVLNGFVAQE